MYRSTRRVHTAWRNEGTVGGKKKQKGGLDRDLYVGEIGM